MINFLRRLRLKFLAFRIDLLDRRLLRLINRHLRITLKTRPLPKSPISCRDLCVIQVAIAEGLMEKRHILTTTEQAFTTFKNSLSEDQEYVLNIYDQLVVVAHDQGLSKVRSCRVAKNFIKLYFDVEVDDK